MPAPQGDPKSERLDRATEYGKSRRTTVDLIEVGQLSEGVLITHRDVEDPVVGEGRQGVESRGFLTSAGSASGDEDACVLASKGTRCPEGAGRVPESLYSASQSETEANEGVKRIYLPLSRHVAVPGRDAKDKGIKLWEFGGLDDFVCGFFRCMHLYNASLSSKNVC